MKEGTQTLRVKVLDGPFAGREVRAMNNVVGKMEIDKIFSVGDTAILVLNVNGDQIVSATAYDQYREDSEVVLLTLFCLRG